ncbi:MAG: crossover junction endodeoxyribonuclease RuvC [Desulfovibrio sp.]|nr:crossover junction endodeoxyribonuclease RuvC [Desulfovibrio sp.]
MEDDIIGIDPGSRRTGWGVIRERSGVLELVDCGVIRARTDAEYDFSQRLAVIYRELLEIISRLNPGEAAVEQVFTAQNARSALKLGQARGAAIAACAAGDLKIYDYEPTLIKKSVVGAGRAEKDQVAFMVKRLLNARDGEYALDTTDALAAAICHAATRRFERFAGKAPAGRRAL